MPSASTWHLFKAKSLLSIQINLSLAYKWGRHLFTGCAQSEISYNGGKKIAISEHSTFPRSLHLHSQLAEVLIVTERRATKGEHVGLATCKSVIPWPLSAFYCFTRKWEGLVSEGILFVASWPHFLIGLHTYICMTTHTHPVVGNLPVKLWLLGNSWL